MNATMPRPMFERIFEATCKYYDVTEAELIAPNTNAETVYRRKILIILVRHHTEMSYKAIALKVGLKSHSWIMDMVSEVESGQGIYRQISDDMTNVMRIVDSLA